MGKEELDVAVFLVVNLLNETSAEALAPAQQIHLADLNLQAAQKAVTFSAYTTAAKYTSRGIELLPSDVERVGKKRKVTFVDSE
jgi:predicted ATPase